MKILLELFELVDEEIGPFELPKLSENKRERIRNVER